jgi:hypothetical protein
VALFVGNGIGSGRYHTVMTFHRLICILKDDAAAVEHGVDALVAAFDGDEPARSH